MLFNMSHKKPIFLDTSFNKKLFFSSKISEYLKSKISLLSHDIKRALKSLKVLWMSQRGQSKC